MTGPEPRVRLSGSARSASSSSPWASPSEDPVPSQTAACEEAYVPITKQERLWRACQWARNSAEHYKTQFSSSEWDVLQREIDDGYFKVALRARASPHRHKIALRILRREWDGSDGRARVYCYVLETLYGELSPVDGVGARLLAAIDAEGLRKPECVAMPEEMSLITCNYPMASRLEDVRLQQQEEEKAKAASQTVPSLCVKQEPGSAEGDTINVRQRPKPVESQEGIQEQDADTITVTPATAFYSMRGERGGEGPSQRDEDNATPDVPAPRERKRRRREDPASSSPKRRCMSSVLAAPAGNIPTRSVPSEKQHTGRDDSRRSDLEERSQDYLDYVHTHYNRVAGLRTELVRVGSQLEQLGGERRRICQEIEQLRREFCEGLDEHA